MAAKTPRNRRERRHPELIGVPEAAERCGVHYRTMRRWIGEGRINAVRVGPKLLKVNADDLAGLLQPTGGGAS
ncbi:excisionase family DNA-binding protein [Mycobacterium riyadhense]|uniref:Helix-turn-helix domain protein n=1 Tax=Mycobacterium riyadhense TaxID=486698 RepID=A0A653F2G2_9MYCO|nr:excisionase family DNA-binding protein [Mycobacterium riyadhense]VTP03964.1 Helix-turn-helix domain protein [Mycobacterium riyadhense]